MSLALADVCDPDCIVSLRPLRFDLPVPHREARGVAAILRRVLYRWCRPRGSVRGDATIGVETPLLDLEGTRLEVRQLQLLRARLLGQARDVDFVDGVSVAVDDLGGGALSIRGAIQLVDGRTYPLEVARAADAAIVLRSIGGAS
jgi:hypothetical protein